MAPCADAKHLAGKGAEVMAVDAMNAAQLAAAFEGAYGVFFVTVPVRDLRRQGGLSMVRGMSDQTEMT